MKTILLNIKILITSLFLIGTFLVSLPVIASSGLQEEQAECDPHSVDDPSRGNIREFKDAYTPKEYHPMPEYMVFVDLGILALLILLGLFFVVKRKSGKPMHILMVITFVYLAFIRGGCVCPVGAITNTVFGIISPAMVGLATVVVFLLPVTIALISGRVFCSAGCPLGSVQHLAKRKNNRKYFKIPKKINTVLKLAPIIILGLTVYYSVNGSMCFFACELDPYKAIFFTGQSWFEQGLAFVKGQPMESKVLIACGIGTWTYLAVILAVGYWVPRPFCRFVCPYGVVLGAVSIFAIKRREINTNNCVQCGLCQKVCPTQAITIDRKLEISKISNYDCIQ